MFMLQALLADGPMFREDAPGMGLTFQHINGSVGRYDIPEEMGPGCAFLDYDNDGFLDVYLVQGNHLENPRPEITDRLYRNEGGKRFRDVTQSLGLTASGIGMGIAVADVNADGWRDLYVLNYGPNQLWLNRGGKQFERVACGVEDPRWSVSASFLDYDRDGDLDLFVVNYLDYRLERRKHCVNLRGQQEYCGPGSYPDGLDRLYRNDSGRFVEVTDLLGLHLGDGSGLGVVVLDVNGDDWPDVYVANDADPNNLWINKKGRRFVDDAMLLGCGVNAEGKAEAGMGIALGDLDRDGREEMILTHLGGETHTIYVPDRTGGFTDLTDRRHLGGPSRSSTGFGVGLLDVDNDGQMEVIVANGAVFTIDHLRNAGDPYPLHQPNQLFTYDNDRRFVDISDRAGSPLQQSDVSRGLALGDVDNDGDLDVLIANNRGPARLWRNLVGQEGDWIGFECRSGGVDVLGARLTLETDRGTRSAIVRTDGSYASSRDPRVLFGLGHAKPVDLVVHWPDGRTSRHEDLQSRRYHHLGPPQ